MRTYHIYPAVPSIVTVNGVNCGLTAPNIECDDDDFFTVSVMPTVENRMPFAFVVNKALSLPAAARVIRLPRNNFDIIADPPKSNIVKYRKPVLFNNDRLTATVLSNDELWIDKLILHLPSDCGEILFDCPVINSARYLEVSAANYLALIDENYNLCGEFHADKITRKGGLIECLILFNDLAGRAHIDKYALEGGKVTRLESYDIYTGSVASRPVDTAMYPLALLQAILAGDIDEARFYLSSELNESLSDIDLREFFPYKDIYPCSYYPNNHVVLLSGDEGKLFKITCGDKYIENIESVDE